MRIYRHFGVFGSNFWFVWMCLSGDKMLREITLQIFFYLQSAVFIRNCTIKTEYYFPFFDFSFINSLYPFGNCVYTEYVLLHYSFFFFSLNLLKRFSFFSRFIFRFTASPMIKTVGKWCKRKPVQYRRRHTERLNLRVGNRRASGD